MTDPLNLRTILGYPAGPTDPDLRPRAACWWCRSPEGVDRPRVIVPECPTCAATTPAARELLTSMVSEKTRRAVLGLYGGGPRYGLRLIVLAASLGYEVHSNQHRRWCSRTLSQPRHTCGYRDCERPDGLDHVVLLRHMTSGAFAALSQPYDPGRRAEGWPILTTEAPYGGGTVAQLITA